MRRLHSSFKSDEFTLCFLSLFFFLCFQIWLISVAVHWSTSDVRPMQFCYNEPVKCALEGCNVIYYACMKCTNTMKLCTTDMIQFSQVLRRHSVIHFKCNFFLCPPAKWCCCLMVHSWTLRNSLTRTRLHALILLCMLQMTRELLKFLELFIYFGHTLD